MYRLFFLLAPILALSGANIREMSAHTIVTSPGLSNSPVSSFQTSNIECTKRCLEQKCAGFAFSANSGNCQLTLSRMKLSLDEHWTFYTRKEVPVVSRVDASVDFYRWWEGYKYDFGEIGGNYWLGLDTLHLLTTTKGDYGLGVNMTGWDGKSHWAYYSSFSVGPESDNYRLSVSGYDVTSTAGDSMNDHNGMNCTTYDRDNDLKPEYNCGARWKGGWWYKHCHPANPTGRYLYGGTTSWEGITWGENPHYLDSYSFKTMQLFLVKL